MHIKGLRGKCKATLANQKRGRHQGLANLVHKVIQTFDAVQSAFNIFDRHDFQRALIDLRGEKVFVALAQLFFRRGLLLDSHQQPRDPR